MHAEDTTLAHVGDDLFELENYANQALNKLVDWCRYNKVTLNPLGCEFLIMLTEATQSISTVFNQWTNVFKYENNQLFRS